jgi:hypothetical protein
MDWPELHRLPLDAIDTDRTWSLHQDLDQSIDAALLASVQKYGPLRAPLVRRSRRSGSGYQVICGAARLQALRAVTADQVFCLVLGPALEPRDMLILAARDQAENGVLSPIETARLALLATTHAGDDAPAILAAHTAIKNSGQRRRIVRLLDLEPPLRQAIHAGSMSTKTGLLLADLPTHDRLFLGRLFTALALNDNKQQRLIEHCRIITAREYCSFQDLFQARYRYCLDLDHRRVNLPQLTNRLLDEIYHHSHPLLTEARQLFADRVKSLHLPSQCTVIPSTSFEYDRVTLSIEFDSLDDLAARLPSLKDQLS